MQSLKEQYEEMSPDRLRDLLANAVLEPDARLLCEQVLCKKLGVEKLEPKAGHMIQDGGLSKNGRVNSFLVQQEVDVSRLFAVVVLANTIAQAITDYREFLLLDSITVNFGIPLGLIVGVGLWRRRSWARKVLLGCLWLAFGFLIAATTSALEPQDGSVYSTDATLGVSGTTVQDISPLSAIAAQIIYLPIIWTVLLVAHSPKFREETSGTRADSRKSAETRISSAT